MVRKVGVRKPRAREMVAEGKPGQPPLAIDPQQVFRLAQTMCTAETIAAVLDCHVDTLYARFSDVMLRGREERKTKLAETMWSKAIDGKDTSMMIWLSKQHLGYRDKQPDEAVHISFNVYTNEIPI